jgi:membrane associated rhomboid family serine protease
MVFEFCQFLFSNFFTQKQLLGVYVLSAILLVLHLYWLFYFLNLSAPIVGASAAIMGLVAGLHTSL